MYILGLDPTKLFDNSAGDIPPFEKGSVGFDDAGKGYQFVQYTATSAVGDVVQIDETGDAIPTTTTTTAAAAGQGLPVGVVLVAGADNDWAWVQRFGVVAAVNSTTGCAAHTEVNSTATAGRVDDDATAGAEIIKGLTITAPSASNTAAGILNWPYVGETVPA